MNRLASAFSNAPSLNSNNSHPTDPPRPSPLDSSFSTRSADDRPRHRSVSPHAVLYDDPRQIHHPEASLSLEATLGPSRRPGLLRQWTDDGLSRSATPRPRDRERDAVDRSVRVNLLAERGQTSRGWGMNIIPGSSRITGMAAGPDGRYAVGGGQYLRVLHIKPAASGSTTPMPPGHAPEPLGKGPGGTTVTEVANLWRGQWGVSRGVNDLDWGVGQMANKVVTACPTGNILIFDVVKGKMEREITGGHARPMNAMRLSKIPSASHVLLTGGMEGHAKIWDLREPHNAQKRYFKHSVAITSVAFCPDSTHNFIVGMDSGTIQRYDMRSPTRIAGKAWGAHGNKPVTDLKWKPSEEGGWMASAGADRTVQVWDMSVAWDKPPSPLHILHTAYPLRSVQWRPGHETELAIVPESQPTQSTSIDPTTGVAPQTTNANQQVDDEAHLEVWDVRRHYVAKYAIGTSGGAAAALHWADDDTIVTAFRTGSFTQSDIRTNRTIPLDSIPRNVTAWNKRGEMAFAMDRFKLGEVPFDDLKSEFSNHWDKVGRKQKGLADEPYEPAQAVGVMPPIETAAEEDHLGYIAEHYRLEGESPEWLCQWNAEVADSCGRRDDSRFWSFLGAYIDEFAKKEETMFDEKVFTNPLQSRSQLATPINMSPRAFAARPAYSPKPIPLSRLDDTLDDVEELISPSSSSSGSSSGSSEKDDEERTTPHRSRFMAFAPLDHRRLSESLTISSRQSSVATAIPTTTTSARATPKTLFAQAVGQATARSKARSGSMNSVGGSDWPDPYGVSAGTPSRMTSSRLLNDYPDPYGFTAKSESSKASPSTCTSKRASPLITAKNANAPPRDSIGGAALESRQGEYGDDEWKVYRMQRAETVLQWWRCYVNDGEMQLATTAYVVAKGLIAFPEGQCERIAHAYVDMLEANRLPRAAAYIRRHAGIPSLEVRPMDEGMTHPVHCVKCRKSTGAVDLALSEGTFWWCKNCRRPAKICTICHKAVKGLWMSCGKCKHGGHQACMRMYFANAEVRTTPPLQSLQSISNPRLPRSTRPSPPATPTTSSHDSSGFDRSDRGRISTETVKDTTTTIPEEGEEMARTWAVCPKGCGCACRVVVAHVVVEEER